MPLRARASFAVFVALVPAIWPGLQDGGATVERRLSVMGTWLGIEVDGATRDVALAASELALRAVEATEARLSTWRDDSELARLNRSPVGEPFQLSAATARDLGLARELWHATEGAFDPGIGGLVRAYGLRTGGRRPEAAELDALLEPRGLASLALEGLSARRLHPLLEVEEGGFGKGVALDEAVRALAAAGIERAELDLGGQIALVGRRPAVVRIADPRDRGRAVLELELTAGSLSTSGNAEHAVTVDGERTGHILDPRTGRPARDFGSMTVLASDATTADALSTGLYVLGPERALRFAALHPPIECLVLEVLPQGLRARVSAGWPGKLVALIEELEIQRLPPSEVPAGIEGTTPLKTP